MDSHGRGGDLERPEVLDARRRPGRWVAVWVALVASLLTGIGDTATVRPRRPEPRLNRTKVGLPAGSRPDLGVPGFTHPTSITNPLFPVSQLTQVIQLGAEGGERVRFELTLLPGTRLVEWNGRQVPTVATQIVAYGDGRVAEVGTDFYAQDDGGAVWHFGEEAANYADGVLVDREGSWLAGRDGRPGMVMPARPRVGDVFRSGRAPGQGAEEVTVRSTDQPVEGPWGRVEGALLLQERLADGTVEDKTFAPGYGEFDARLPTRDELYRVALAVPTDAVPGAVPADLAIVSSLAAGIVAGRGRGEVHEAVHAMTEAWAGHAPGQGPGILVSEMSDRLADLLAAAAADRPARVHSAALAVAHAGLDLQLRHRAPADVDRDRLRLWAAQLLADAATGDEGAVQGDVVVLDAVRARIAQPADAALASLDARLAELRAAAAAGDLPRAAEVAGALAAP